MKINLNGKTALISGAAQGIGQAIALKFKEAGARLILIDKSSEKLEKLASEIGSNVVTCSLDVSNEKDIVANVGSILKHEKRIDILVNNAATVTRRAKITELDFKEWQNALVVNLNGVFLLSRIVIPKMQQSGGGVILNIASQLGHVGIAGATAY